MTTTIPPAQHQHGATQPEPTPTTATTMDGTAAATRLRDRPPITIRISETAIDEYFRRKIEQGDVRQEVWDQLQNFDGAGKAQTFTKYIEISGDKREREDWDRKNPPPDPTSPNYEMEKEEYDRRRAAAIFEITHTDGHINFSIRE